MAIGFSELSSFSKAFSREFGVSPQEFKNNREIVLNTHVDYRINDTGTLISDIQPKFLTLPDKHVLYITVTGVYGGEQTALAWELLLDFAVSNKVLGWNPDLFSLYYDDPDESWAEHCRSEICVATGKQLFPAEGMGLKVVSGGKFAVFRYKGPYERLWELYNFIYRNWVMKSAYILRNSPVIEKYLNFSPKTKPNDLITEIYLPVQ
jgi:AraC family transcriptional regulator